MSDESLGNEALIAFLKALSMSVVLLDKLKPKPVGADSFLLILDKFLEEVRDLPELGGPPVYERAMVLRQLLGENVEKARTLAEILPPDGIDLN